MPAGKQGATDAAADAESPANIFADGLWEAVAPSFQAVDENVESVCQSQAQLLDTIDKLQADISAAAGLKKASLQPHTNRLNASRDRLKNVEDTMATIDSRLARIRRLMSAAD
jgi:hypothetical protein